MEAGKFLDAIACAKGYVCKANDATSAYTQVYLVTTDRNGNVVENWVMLPRNRWPKEWEGVCIEPLVPLVLALYGHPESGGHWEKGCEERVATKGWIKLAEEWNSVFWHPVKEAMLIIYVDDFKMAAKAEDHDQL